MKLDGVYYTELKNGTKNYRASITYKTKHISLGSFTNPEAANAAYMDAKSIISSDCGVDQYNNSMNISFEKYIVLINYRDNNIYFTTPIYLGKKMFYYYVSSECVLKFDMDDLFYFSARKICQRDNHLFVADYGMQLNIIQRFGIKPYGVVGRDYCFINGDNTDFRRQNIEIISVFNGVSLESKKGKRKYLTKIHIKGSVIVGRYDSEIEAAIAYNKAVDILKSKGSNKNYKYNDYIDISGKEYASIYSQLKISDYIMNINL